MMPLHITRHAEVRLSQRGIRHSDLNVLLDHGTDIGQNKLMLRAQDAERVIRNLKKQIARIQRLTDKVIVVSEGTLITAYHQSNSRRTKRKGRIKRHWPL